MAKSKIERAIALLENIKPRKGMYFGSTNFEHGERFLTGLRGGLMIAGIPIGYNTGLAVLERRGWELSSRGAMGDMRDKGLTDEQMLDELIDAFIEELRRLPKRRRKKGGKSVKAKAGKARG